MGNGARPFRYTGSVEGLPPAAVRPPGRWTLDQAAWDALLGRLGAPERYEALRARLIRFFRWERCAESEEMADEVLNRVARRLVEGEAVLHLDAYVSGVGRMVLRESATRDRRRERALGRMPDPAPEEPDTAAQECLERHLASLPSSDRALILSYYTGERSARIENRKRLAAQLGVNVNALRNRALRLRARLEAQVRACLESRDGSRDGTRGGPTSTRERGELSRDG